MNTILMWLIAIAAILGGLDKILGNRFGLGKRFDDGFALLGPLVSGMTGILCLTPLLSRLLRSTLAPFLQNIGIDPAIPAGILPIDMGGYPLAAEMASDPRAGLFAGIFIASTFGCTLIFTLPVGLGLVRAEMRPDFISGIMTGLITLPITLLLGGLFCGLKLKEVLLESLPILILALFLILGIRFRPMGMMRLFEFFTRIILALSVLGILLSLTGYLTGFSPVPGILPLPEALLNSSLCGILLIGSLPFAEILNRLLRAPLHALGSRAGMKDNGIMGLLLGIVSVAAALGLMHEMDEDDIALNAAFLVSSASVFGPHFGICAANQPEMITPLMFVKLTGGVLTAAVIMILRKKNRRSAQ